MLMTWLLVWIASIGVPAAMRPITGTATGRLPSSSEVARTRPRLPSITLGVKPRERCAAGDAVRDRFRQLDHLDGARAVWQAADEAALLERRDQPMDAGLGAQVERILHLVEGGRHAGFLQPLMDEAQKLELLACQHLGIPPAEGQAAGRMHSGLAEPRAETNHEQTLSVPYVFRNHLIWSEQLYWPPKPRLKDGEQPIPLRLGGDR